MWSWLTDQIMRWVTEVSFGTFWTVIAYSAVMLASITTAFVLREAGYASLFRAGAPNAFALLIGAVAGWALGVFWVPFNTMDAKVYEQIGATVTAFATGYLLSKFDRVFEVLLYIDDDKKMPNRTVLRRAAFLAVGLCATALLVTSSRLDWLGHAMRCAPKMFDEKSTMEPDSKSCEKAKMSPVRYASKST